MSHLTGMPPLAGSAASLPTPPSCWPMISLPAKRPGLTHGKSLASPPKAADAQAIPPSLRRRWKSRPWSGLARSWTAPSAARWRSSMATPVCLILDPDAETQDRYRKISAARTARFQFLTQQADLPAVTLDGHAVELWGNIEFRGEVEACLDRGAVGVGLFRTEFLFLGAEAPPSEEQQFEAYKAVVSLDARPADLDQNARSRRRQDRRVSSGRLRGPQPGAGVAQPAVVAASPRAFPDSTPRSPAGERAGRRPDPVPLGVHSRRAPASAGRLGTMPPPSFWPRDTHSPQGFLSASWSRCPPPP